MIFRETPLAGAYVIELEKKGDDRGFFARAFCANEFAEHGLTATISQVNTSFNHRRGTLRGLHYQEQPAPEAKLVRCVAGAIFAMVFVAIGLRMGYVSLLRDGAEPTQRVAARGGSTAVPLPPPSSLGGVREDRWGPAGAGVFPTAFGFGTRRRVTSPWPTVQRLVVTQ